MRIFIYYIKVIFVILTTCFQAQDDIFIAPNTSSENPIISGVIHIKSNTILSIGNKSSGQLINNEESADINLGHIFKQTFASSGLASKKVLKVSKVKKIVFNKRPIHKIQLKLVPYPLQQFFQNGSQLAMTFLETVQRLVKKISFTLIDKIRFNLFIEPINKNSILSESLINNGRLLSFSSFSRPPPFV